MYGALASFTTRYRRLILSATGVVAVVAAWFSLSLHANLTSGWSDWDEPGADNVTAREIIEAGTGADPQQGYVVLVDAGQSLNPAAEPPAVVRATIDLLRSRPEVTEVVDYRSARNPALIAKDGRSTIVIGHVRRVTENRVVPPLEKLINADPQLSGKVVLGGLTTGGSQMSAVVLHDLVFAELIVFPLLFLALVVVFRGVVAALLPLTGGAVTLLITMLTLRGLVEIHDISIFGLNLAFALGLGLSIDFSLLIVSRYRESLASNDDPGLALSTTLRTAGRTVLYSALTVGSALTALLIFPQRFLYSMGLAGIIVVASALFYALVVLPAILAVLGHRVEGLAPKRWQRRFDQDGTKDPSAARWRRLSIAVMRRPLVFALAATALLLVLSAPLANVRFTAVQAGNVLPTSVSAGYVERHMAQRFAVPLSDQEYVVVDAPATAGAEIARLADQLRAVDGVVAVEPAKAIGADHWMLAVNLRGKPVSEESKRAVKAIENLNNAAQLRVTGPTADAITLNASLARHLPLAGAILIVSTIVFLFIMTGSILLPLKAVVMNALSLGAALGLITFIFQDGHFASVFGTTGQGALDSSIPILIAAVAFGLSTDYGVFLLDRMKESHDQGLDNRDAVAAGIEHTGRIVTSAAILMSLAWLAMLLSRIVMIKELGLGGAFAVVLDATIVRALLVPALMALLGDLNWWAPSVLRFGRRTRTPDQIQESARV